MIIPTPKDDTCYIKMGMWKTFKIKEGLEITSLTTSDEGTINHRIHSRL